VPAPHRGDANNPITNQGKANAIKTQTRKRRAGNPDQGKANAIGEQTRKRRTGNQNQGNPIAGGKQTNKRRAGNQSKKIQSPQAHQKMPPPKAKKTFKKTFI
jgi:hypothetical protein